MKGKRRFWSDAECEMLRLMFPDMKTEKVALKLGRSVSGVNGMAAKLRLSKSEKYLASPDACRLRRDASVGIPYRFGKGHVPANKGLRRPGYAPGRMSETQFVKGRHPHTWKPIGTTRYSKEGYLQRKVTETGYPPRDWIAVHNLLWTEVNGSIPPGHAVAFKDGDKSRIAIENLELISRAELMRRNTIHRYPSELRNTIMLLGAVKRKVREHAEEHDDRSAQPSV